MVLPDDLQERLDAYCSANENAARVNVVRRAIREYIAWRLEGDAQLRTRFEEELRAFKPTQAPGGVGEFRVLKGDKSE